MTTQDKLNLIDYQINTSGISIVTFNASYKSTTCGIFVELSDSADLLRKGFTRFVAIQRIPEFLDNSTGSKIFQLSQISHIEVKPVL